MRCANHIQAEAIGTCCYCGKPFCKDCLAEIHGRYYCREHAAYAYRDQPQRYIPPAAPPPVVNNYLNTSYGAYPYKSLLVAALLCLFFGYLGIHRFYTGKIGTGLIWFFTGGFFVIGWILDLIFIILGFFRDKAGYPLM